MKVSVLIEKLSEMPQDALVYAETTCDLETANHVYVDGHGDVRIECDVISN